MKTFDLQVALLVLLTLACSGDDVGVLPPPGPVDTRPSVVSAVAEGQPFNATAVRVVRGQSSLAFEAKMRLESGEEWQIRALMRTDVGGTPQAIGSSNFVTGDVYFDPVFDVGYVWLANRIMGSGSITLSSISADRAVGSFSFTAHATSTYSQPAKFRVTNGTFDVRAMSGSSN